MSEILLGLANWLVMPALILAPLYRTWRTAPRSAPGADPALAARLQNKLTLATAAMIAAWFIRFVLDKEGAPRVIIGHLGNAFPIIMWDQIALPAIHAKDPSKGKPLGWSDIPAPSFFAVEKIGDGPRRPLQPTHWLIATIFSGVAFYILAIRGLHPFAKDALGRTEERIWIAILVAFGVIAAINVVAVTIAVRRQATQLAAPDARRSLKSKGRFWLLNVAVPALAWAMMFTAVWWPGDVDAILRVGAIGAGVIGFGGAVFAGLWSYRIRRGALSEQPG